MLSFTILFLTLALWPIVTQQESFSSPHYVVAYGTGNFESNVVWYVGQTRQVAYNISDVAGLGNYTIALWQQSAYGAGAHLGPVVESTNLPDVRDSFNWTVQLYDFDLSKSNVFFFWLANGSESNQGDTSVSSLTSAYFNISDEAVSSSSTSALSTSATSESTLSATSLSTASASATTTPEAGDTGPAPSSGSTGGGGGISTGAGIGIGIGVGLAAISAIACVGLIVWYKRRKANSGQRHQELIKPRQLHPGNNAYTKPLDRYTASSSPYNTVPRYGPNPEVMYGKAVNYGAPAELNSGSTYQPAEMDANGTGRR